MMMCLIQRCYNRVICAVNRNILSRSSKEFYISKISRKAAWVYISYISDAFYHTDDSYFQTHQNKREAIAIVNIFNNIGYNVFVQNYSSSLKLPNLKNVEIVFGIEPLFGMAIDLYHPKIKIYYATGAYWEHQNKQIIWHTDAFNMRFASKIPYRRLVKRHNSCEIADHIIQIGSKYTLQTYPDTIKRKIILIHQSSLCYFPNNIKRNKENEFMFMASSGSILKGFDIVVDFFSNNPQYIVHIVGPIEDDVIQAMGNKITPNILLHGWLQINGSEIQYIAGRCNFFIYPSRSEGGASGAVLCAMKMGLIPILSKWAAFDEIEDYGYLLNALNTQALTDAMNWCKIQTKENVVNLKRRCSEFVNYTYNIRQFSKEFSDILISCIGDGN